jgi:hypothetical protein
MARHPLFPSLSAADAERMATWSEELTVFLRHMRSQQQAIDKENADSLARHQELRALPHKMLTDLELGYSPQEAVRRAQARFNISDQYDDRLAVQHARRTVKKRSKRRRDLLIVRLAGRGWSNERID